MIALAVLLFVVIIFEWRIRTNIATNNIKETITELVNCAILATEHGKQFAQLGQDLQVFKSTTGERKVVGKL